MEKKPVWECIGCDCMITHGHNHQREYNVITKEIQTQADEAAKTYWTKQTWQEKQTFVRGLDNKVLAAMSSHLDIVEDVKKIMSEHAEATK